MEEMYSELKQQILIILTLFWGNLNKQKERTPLKKLNDLLLLTATGAEQEQQNITGIGGSTWHLYPTQITRGSKDKI